jgi:hypothetical protein
MLTIDARCRDDFCVAHKTGIYRMVGSCENCGTEPILFLLTEEHERGYDHRCPVCGVSRARPRRLATDEEIPVA